jgi:hypothetical protein
MYPQEDEREMRSAKTLWRFLDAVATQGFYLTTGEWLERWWEPPPEVAAPQQQDAADEAGRSRSGRSSRHATAPGISPALRAEVEAYAGGAEEGLSFTAYSVAPNGPLVGMNAWTATMPGELDWFIDSYTFYGWPAPPNMAALDAYLALLVATYEVWRPLFGYMPAPFAPNTSAEQARSYQPQFLYEINLLGPEIVRARGGLECVLRTPARRERALHDGGVLLVPRSWLEVASRERLSQEAAVARHLNLPDEPYGQRAARAQGLR